jgi:hypothetical protein
MQVKTGGVEKGRKTGRPAGGYHLAYRMPPEGPTKPPGRFEKYPWYLYSKVFSGGLKRHFA